MVIGRDDWGQAGEGEAAGLKRGGEWGGEDSGGVLEEEEEEEEERSVTRRRVATTVEVSTIFGLTL